MTKEQYNAEMQNYIAVSAALNAAYGISDIYSRLDAIAWEHFKAKTVDYDDSNPCY